MAKADYVNETNILHEVCTDPNCRYKHTKHALEQMAARDVTHADIEHVLTNGHVTLIETNKTDVLWRMEGKDTDGRRLQVVASVDAEEIWIKVITVF